MTIQKNFYCVPEPGGVVRIEFVLPPGSSCNVILQRSRDLKKGETLVQKHFVNTLKTDLTFVMRDTDPYAGMSFYRLKIVDADSTELITPYKEVRVKKEGLWVNVMQAHKEEISLEVNNAGPGSSMLVVIYDSLGNEITSILQQLKRGGDELLRVKIPNGLKSGLYQVVTALNNSVFSGMFKVTS